MWTSVYGTTIMKYLKIIAPVIWLNMLHAGLFINQFAFLLLLFVCVCLYLFVCFIMPLNVKMILSYMARTQKIILFSTWQLSAERCS